MGNNSSQSRFDGDELRITVCLDGADDQAAPTAESSCFEAAQTDRRQTVLYAIRLRGEDAAEDKAAI